ncbi:Ephrin type-A receptor 3 [Rhizoctonia solani]|uniref:Ephrin type-A receptor 3 n=1 Tax=Rhizoctonia solani TaxID=456999 RepID=A0A0K6G8D8_9AGAM|nr:Ephrin type-A receptor 3 [Rhizoctonia solani]
MSPVAFNFMSNSPTLNTIGSDAASVLPLALAQQAAPPIPKIPPIDALTVESPPIASPVPFKSRSALELSESTGARPRRLKSPLKSLRASSRGPIDPQINTFLPVRESSTSLPIGNGKRRYWFGVKSLAAFLGLRVKGRVGESASTLKEHGSNVNDTSVSAGQPRFFPEIPEVESQDIDAGPPAAIAQPVATSFLQPHVSLTPSPPPPHQEPLDHSGGLISGPTLQEDSSVPDVVGQADNPGIPRLVVNNRHPAMSRQMPAQEIVSQLIKRGCKDLSDEIDKSTFVDLPFAAGGLSDIYCGYLRDGRPVAVKALRIAAQQSMGESPEHRLRAARELHTWSKCNHPNVLRLYGLATFRDRIGMVSPWMSKGTLPRYLRDNPNANRRDMCIQICDGLSHIHEAGIVHGDLKGANILVDDNNNAVLADFGSSTLKDQSLKFTQAASSKAHTIRWSAPELVMANDCQHTKASDVFALGMTIYEVLAGKVPYHETKELASLIFKKIQRDTPTRFMSTPNGHASLGALWQLFTLCWKYETEQRPSAAKVAEMLKAISMDGVVYHLDGISQSEQALG